MTYAVYLVETLTGRVGAKLPVAATGSWTDAINGPSAIEVKVPTKWLLAQPRVRWAAWSASLLACWDGHPLVLGPILDDPEGDDKFVTLRAGGLWSLLEHRVVTDADHLDGAALARSALRLNAGSLGTVARQVVEYAQKRPAGWFPLSFASPAEEGATRTREYQGFNISNNSAAKRLQEITEVINGPDIAFRPRWVRPGIQVEWVMHHGTEAMPELAQEHSHVLDLTARKSKAVARKVTSKYLPIRRVYASGSGQDQGTLIRIEEEPVVEGLPHLEAVMSDTQIEDAELLSSKAKGLLKRGRQVQISASVLAQNFPPHTWWAGEAWTMHWPAGWVQLDKGAYRTRCINRTGRLDSQVIDMEMQPEEMV